MAKFKESPKNLAELLTMHAFEVESVAKAGNDFCLDIAVQKSNRAADCAGHIGVAQEIIAIKNLKVKIQNAKSQIKIKNGDKKLLTVTIENKDDCRRYIGVVMNGVVVKESPQWLRERLETCGMQSINNLVDAANYVMLETGQPLHIFDYDALEGRRIAVRRARKNEFLKTLDNQKLELSPDALVIADAKNPIALAGIKGGFDSGVSKKTKTIVLEAANFDPALIRSASRLFNLKTDASFRFEHNLDPNLAEVASMRLVELVRQVAGGEVIGMTDIYPQKILPQKIFLSRAYAENLIGCELPARRIEDLLKRLGFIVTQKKKDGWIAEVPTIRRDVSSTEDIIEEIARLYGYKHIAMRAPETLLFPAEPNDELLWEDKVRDFFKGAGFSEAYTYIFTGEKEIRDFEDAASGYVELENPTSPETRYLVKHSIFKYARALAENLRHTDEARLFAVTKDFEWRMNKIEERKELIAAFGKKGKSASDIFLELKGVAENLLSALGVSDFWFDDAPNSRFQIQDSRFYHPYRRAEIKIGDDAIGIIGEIHPAIAQTIKLKSRAVFLHIDFGKLWHKAESEHEYRPISKYPAAVRDIALLVPRGEKIEKIQNVIETSGGDLLQDVDLFDYFEEFDKEKEKMSVAFHLRFQSNERTLLEKEVDVLMKKITEAVKEKQWAVRE
ncbi:phenylalanine--tRNA ligase subunit beta [Patescibacteria group bacterium]|nr:phenylalanine--tRNA ligase subunit beta [Patescibacteria group bacterium]